MQNGAPLLGKAACCLPPAALCSCRGMPPRRLTWAYVITQVLGWVSAQSMKSSMSATASLQAAGECRCRLTRRAPPPSDGSAQHRTVPRTAGPSQAAAHSSPQGSTCPQQRTKQV